VAEARRTARDPERTRRRILDAARRVFATRGIDGARVDAIAARAGTNKRMLYYYFGSKDGLFRAVLRQRLADRAPTSQLVRVGPDRLADLHDRLASQPDYVRLLMWEALERGRRHPLEEEEARRAVLAEWVDALRAAQADGQIPADLDPAQLALSELGIALIPLAFPQLTWLLTGRRPDDPDFLAERHAFLGRLGEVLDDRVPAGDVS
jgi:TetR/AcrR family transcriptional regulator